MKGIFATMIITVIIISIFELLLPNGNIKKIAISVMSIIVIAIILTPIAEFLSLING